MKKSLSYRYKEMFRELLFPLGFRLYKKTFYRQCNDVLQTVMLVGGSGNFDIEFDISSLGLPIRDLYCEGYSVSIFVPRDQIISRIELSDDEWLCKQFLLFQQNVLPIFQKGIDAGSAYEELICFQKKTYVCIPGGIGMNNFNFVCMRIQRQDYDRAFRHMLAIVAQNIGQYHHAAYWLENEHTKFFQYVQNEQKQYKPHIQERIQFLEKLSEPDTLYLQRFIEENTAKSLEVISHPRYS